MNRNKFKLHLWTIFLLFSFLSKLLSNWVKEIFQKESRVINVSAVFSKLVNLITLLDLEQKIYPFLKKNPEKKKDHRLR